MLDKLNKKKLTNFLYILLDMGIQKQADGLLKLGIKLMIFELQCMIFLTKFIKKHTKDMLKSLLIQTILDNSAMMLKNGGMKMLIVKSLKFL